MFYFHDGLFLTPSRLGIDVQRPLATAFISHAHADHMACHRYTYCTPETARFYQHRRGRRLVREMPYDQPVSLGPLQLTALPAGHILGSAMLLVTGKDRSLLYTGDFKIRPNATAAPITIPRADILIMESTFGDPRFRFPARDEAIGQLIAHLEEALTRDRVPIIHAYVLGKAQEITRILNDHGFAIQQHRLIYSLSQLYEQAGCRLGPIACLDERPRAGHVVIAPPPSQRATLLLTRRPPVRIAVTGWAMDPTAVARLQVDHAVPLSDHADYDELLELVNRVQPGIIFCTHGPATFVDRLRQLGHNAYPLDHRSSTLVA